MPGIIRTAQAWFHAAQAWSSRPFVTRAWRYQHRRKCASGTHIPYIHMHMHTHTHTRHIHTTHVYHTYTYTYRHTHTYTHIPRNGRDATCPFQSLTGAPPLLPSCLVKEACAVRMARRSKQLFDGTAFSTHGGSPRWRPPGRGHAGTTQASRWHFQSRCPTF